MQTSRPQFVSSLVVAFASGAAVAVASIGLLSSPAQAITPQPGQPGQQYGQQQYGGHQQYRVVAFDGRSAQQLQQLLTAESAGGWRLMQLSGNLLILQR
jgi:hypothetical protein